MPTFRYTAVDNVGNRSSGFMDAANAAAVVDHFHSRHYLLLSADELGRVGKVVRFLNTDVALVRSLPRTAIVQFTRELAVMLQAGQDIDRALRFLVEVADAKSAKKILQSVRDQVRSGKSLATSLAEHPQVFSRTYISLVRAGEAGGRLAASLWQLADMLERETRLSATIRSALIYPAFLVTAAIGTIFLLLTVVLPQFTPIFQQAGAKLPWQTRVLIRLGDIAHDDGVLIAMLSLSTGLLAYRLLRVGKVRLAVEKLLYRAPVVGTLTCRTDAARLMRTLGTLLANGVSLVNALAISRDVLGSLTATGIVDHAISKVKAGARLAAALSEGDFFPLQTIHLVQLGEETGRLGEMALRAADIHDDQVNQVVQRLLALLVPVITIVMGMAVAGIVGSLLAAMMSLNDLAN